ncbi:pyrimidine-nucleoside phosphorylase [Dehalobacterium formicoaceticum]|uniref:Pyrimidine-nucleoside phosphorylase n=1 Tax=Dehalobacterium formicoaceticum TaxID=51515 RepID=A0ABT1Y4M0_9FIRM|nr:pyrimidine-nucleoside phosphorylase [Dehalobacterium formicoaceticum]MCR6545820.1 pyrimidine-nucleoside phosphorylase [Dehalobacterium formicoaceticum]
MRMYDIINKKKHGIVLTQEEMAFWVQGFAEGNISDYQAAALLMAIYFQGLSIDETSSLTSSMIDSGETIDLSRVPGIKGDKHSTGGVGDKTTLVLAPLLASMGITVAKMSGRGLGHTGGTLDKLESIPGFQVDLSPEEFMKQVENIGVAIVGQTRNLVPADKKIYALRDVTATVDSVPLIAASVMSKKLAAGADIIVLDVKFGSGAFMKTRPEAENLARMMVDIGKKKGKKMAAILTGMETPLGYAVGNALEVKEAIHVLQGEGPQDLRELSVYLTGITLWLAGKVSDAAKGRVQAEKHLDDGSALEKFRELIAAQHGNPQVIYDESLFPEGKFRYSLLADQDGYLGSMDTEGIGLAAMKLGAGRSKKEDLIDPAAGIIFYKKTGDRIRKGETIAMLHGNNEEQIDEGRDFLKKSLTLQQEAKAIPSLIDDLVII